jgi:hypothetical protein
MVRIWGFLTAMLICWAAPAQADAVIDPLTLYGSVATYDIVRNGEPVGQHRITFSRDGDKLRVNSQSTIDISVLFIPAYRFQYAARSIWEDGILAELEATTEDDGEKYRVKAIRRGDQLWIEGPAGGMEAPTRLGVSEHWSRSFLDTGKQLNTIKGTLDQIRVDRLPPALVPLAQGHGMANRFRIDGDIQFETWYDDSGRWLGMRFAAKDESIIEYRCASCRADLAQGE